MRAADKKFLACYALRQTEAAKFLPATLHLP